MSYYNFMTSGSNASLNRTCSFDPDTICGLLAWYDASDITSITKDCSNFVSTWADKKGCNDLTQCTGADQPQWIDASRNCNAIIRFDGSTDYIFSSTPNDAAPNTIFMALKLPTNSGSARRIFSKGAAGHQETFQKETTAQNYALIMGTSSSGSGSCLDNTWHEVFMLFESSGNGVLEINETCIVNASLTAAENLNGISIGGTYTGTNESDIDVGEILVYDSEISGTDKTDILDYLQNKWSV